MSSSSSTPPADPGPAGGGGSRDAVLWILVAIWFVLMGFAAVSLFNPRWLQRLSRPGAEAEAISYADRGDRLLRQGDFEGALVWYERARAARPDFVLTQVNTAVTYGRLGRLDQGIRMLEDALAGHPEGRGVILYNLAELHWRKEETDRAVSRYGEALALGGRPELIHARLGDIAAGRGRPDEACVEYGRAIQAWLDPVTVYRNMLSSTRESAGHDSAQVRAVDAALARETTAEELSRYDLEFLQRQLETNPEVSRLLGKLGTIEARLRSAEAAGHLARALEVWPANPQASEYQAVLERLRRDRASAGDS